MKAIRSMQMQRGAIDAEILNSELFCDLDSGHRSGKLDLFRALMLTFRTGPRWSERAAETDLSDLDIMYCIGSEEVATFLTKNEFLVRLLNEAAPKLQKHFGDSVRVHLEVFSDPDQASDGELFARVLTTLSARQALSILDRFDKEWWFRASLRSKCLLNFALRYV